MEDQNDLTTKEMFDSATELRLSLARQGWDARPSVGKQIMLPKWNEYTEIPTDQQIKEWSMMQWSPADDAKVPALSTGIRLDGDIIAIDVDVEDRALSEAVEDLVYQVFGQQAAERMPMRHSERDSFMMLARCNKPVVMLRTAKFDDLDGDGSHMVELYGGGHGGKFFGLYGPHSADRMYVWAEGPEPLNMTPDDLPLVLHADVKEFMMRANDLLLGWTGIAKREKSTEMAMEPGYKEVEFDIPEGAVFDTLQDGELTYDQVVDTLEAGQHLACSATWLDGVRHDNRTRCTMTLDRNGTLVIYDLGTGITHKEPRAERKEPDKAMLREMMRESFPVQVAEMTAAAAETSELDAEFEAKVAYLHENLAFNGMTGACHYLDSKERIWAHVALGTVKGVYRPWDQEVEGPRGGVQRMSPVGVWALSPDKLIVDGVRFNPRTTARVFEKGGVRMANGFFGFGEAPMEEDVEADQWLEDFFVHLVPNDEERYFLWQWCATKYQKPWTRSSAILFMANGIQGAGRGTLFSLLDKAFNGYSTTVSETDLLGGRFNGFMENNLLVFCNEVGGASWSERKKGYEVLKDRVDPSHTSITIERKGIEAYKTETFASFMLATNNPAAMAMDAEDRRFAVITNGGTLVGHPMLKRLDAIGKERIAAQLARVLSTVNVMIDTTLAPDFEGREELLTANETTLDDAIHEVINGKDGRDPVPEWRAWTRKRFEDAVKAAMDNPGGRIPGLRNAVTDLVGQRAARAGAYLLKKRVKVGGLTVAVVAKDPDGFMRLSPDDRAKVVSGKVPDWEGTNILPYPG